MRLRSTAPPTCRETARPSRGVVVRRRSSAGRGTSRARGSGSTPSGRAGRRHRSPASGRGGFDASSARPTRRDSAQAESRFRPLRAPALQDARPARVDMRARNPCLPLPAADVGLVGALHRRLARDRARKRPRASIEEPVERPRAASLRPVSNPQPNMARTSGPDRRDIHNCGESCGYMRNPCKSRGFDAVLDD